MKGQKDWREYELHCVQAHHVRLWRLQFNVETGGNKEFDLKDSPALLSVALAYHLVRGEWDLLLRLFHLPPLFLLAPAFSPTACTEKAWQRVRVRVCATRSLGKRALLRNYKQEEGHIHHKHAPPPPSKHTQFTIHSPCLPLFPTVTMDVSWRLGSWWRLERRAAGVWKLKNWRIGRSQGLTQQPTITQRDFFEKALHNKGTDFIFMHCFLRHHLQITQTFRKGRCSSLVCCFWMRYDSVFNQHSTNTQQWFLSIHRPEQFHLSDMDFLAAVQESLQLDWYG